MTVRKPLHSLIVELDDRRAIEVQRQTRFCASWTAATLQLSEPITLTNCGLAKSLANIRPMNTR